MRKLLIYVGGDRQLDLDRTVRIINAMGGVSNPRLNPFMGALYECEYNAKEANTIVRMAEGLQILTADGIGPAACEFALRIRDEMRIDFRLSDNERNFDWPLSIFSRSEDVRRAIDLSDDSRRTCR